MLILASPAIYNLNDFYQINYPDIEHESPIAQDEDGNTVLHKYVSNHKFIPNFVERVIDQGGILEQRNNTGKTPFLYSVVHCQKEIMESFIQIGADVNTTDSKGNSALHYLALSELNITWEISENFEIKEASLILGRLLEKGANVNCRNNHGETPLMWASRGLNKHLSIVKTLLASGADVHLQDEKMKTCLHFVTTYEDAILYSLRYSYEQDSILKELVKNNAPLNYLDDEGMTALGHYFIKFPWKLQFLGFALCLIKYGTLVNWKFKHRLVFHLSTEERLSRRYCTNQRLCEDAAIEYYKNIKKMRNVKLSEESNLCQFALRGLTEGEKKEQESAFKIYDVAMKYYIDGNFINYNDDLLSNISIGYLRWRISEFFIFAKGGSPNIALKFDEIYKISDYLCHFELAEFMRAIKWIVRTPRSGTPAR